VRTLARESVLGSLEGADRQAAVEQLVAASRAGDAQAFGHLYAEYARWVRRYAVRLVRDRARAEDLVAEAFARTWAQLAAGRGPRSGFAAYLRATVVNLHLSQLKKDRNLRWVADIETAAMADPDLAAHIIETSPEDQAIARLLNTRMRVALESLPPRWQVVLLAVYVENESYASVAADLGISLDATYHLAHRARAGMRGALAELARPDSAA
jgi:RNA polymerase sigma factor (sigma-70 family)